jgi:glycolate oxidase FAD binding subunit
LTQINLPENLTGLLNPEAIVPQQRLGDYALDGIEPRAALRPGDRKATSEIMRWASSQRHSVFPRGGGTQLVLGNVPEEVGLVLDLSRQSQMLGYQPADLTATVQAGITLEQLQRELAVGGKFLPLEAPLAQTSTIGGILAANASGPLRYSYRQPRDWLIGISVVGADGTETKAGGKVVKNVTGYDLNKLYTGSLGTLGVIVEATFKLSPYPTGHGAMVARFSGLSEAIAASGKLLRQPFGPQGVQVMDVQAIQRINAQEGLLEQPARDEAMAIAFFAGRPGAVNRQLEDTGRLLKESGSVAVTSMTETEGRSLLKGVTDLGWAPNAQPYLSIKSNVPPSALSDMISRCLRDAPLGLPPGILADPGFGQVRFFWWAGSVGDWLDDGLVLEAILKIREYAREAGGSAVVEFCPLSLKKVIDVWGDQPGGMEIMHRIKQEFDPLGIMSPGRFVGKI